MKKLNVIGLCCGVLLAIVAIVLMLMPFLKKAAPKSYTEDHPAYIGRLTIPAVQIDVACYEFEPHGQEEAEEMYIAMDEEDSAVKFWFSTNTSGSYVIADHNYQGFKTLKNCQPGDEVFITSPEGIKVSYTVVECFTGHNLASDGNSSSNLTDDEYNSVLGLNPDGIILYTCLDSWKNVQIVFLQPMD